MATREENLKKINTELEKLSDEELDKVAGGSWYISEKEAKMAGIKLLKEDGSPGSFGYLWNTGDYYWKGEKISWTDAGYVSNFTEWNGKQPGSIDEAKKYFGEDGSVPLK